MRSTGKITKVYYFSPHEGHHSKIVLEIKTGEGKEVAVEKIATQEALADEFGFFIRAPHQWVTDSIENRSCELEITDDKVSFIRYI